MNTIIALADDNGLNIDGSIKFDLSNKGEIESKCIKKRMTRQNKRLQVILKSSSMRLGEPIVVERRCGFSTEDDWQDW